jgi:hypothetical protein
MQELSDSSKRSNLTILGTEEGEVQAKGIYHIFNKIIIENFPNLEKVLPIKVQEASRTPNIFNQTRTPHSILSLKQQAQRTEKEY